MALDYRRLRSTTAREIVSALMRDGFALRRQTGSHRHYGHKDGRRVTVTYHAGSETFEIKTLRSMIERQARWAEVDVTRLGLLK
jgi:predicted RNA binding protein YcfA (HicA-like mRNA interferase family)